MVRPMRLYEFIEQKDIDTSRYDPAQDKLGVAQLSDVRKKKLTLRDLNRLKRMRASKKLEDEQREDLLGIIYGQPDETAMGGPPGF